MGTDDVQSDDAGEEQIPLTPEATSAMPAEQPPTPPTPPTWAAPTEGGLPSAPPLNDAPQAQLGPNGEPLAGYWRRVGGYLIDAILVGAVAGLIAVVVFHAHATTPVYFGLLVEFIYATVLITVWHGQTLGMKALGIRCVDPTGGEVSWGRSAGRAAVHAVLGIIFFLGFVDLLWPAWDKRNQTLHDKAASTLVIKL